MTKTNNWLHLTGKNLMINTNAFKTIGKIHKADILCNSKRTWIRLMPHEKGRTVLPISTGGGAFIHLARYTDIQWRNWHDTYWAYNEEDDKFYLVNPEVTEIENADGTHHKHPQHHSGRHAKTAYADGH